MSFKIIAHRCRGFGAQENTIKALILALKSGVEEVEIDIQLTKDNIPVMIHNPWFRKEKKIVYINKITFNELKSYDDSFASLEETLDSFVKYSKKYQIINIDIKQKGKEKLIMNMIRKKGVKDRVKIVSWLPAVLRTFKNLDPEIKTSYSFTPIPKIFRRLKKEVRLFDKGRSVIYINDTERFDVEERLSHANYLSSIPKNVPCESINLMPKIFVTRRIVNEAHRMGKKVFVVNCDNKLCSSILKLKGVDGIMTNKPERFLKTQ